MKTRKKILSLLLAATMVLSLFPATALAADWAAEDGNTDTVRIKDNVTVEADTVYPYYVVTHGTDAGNDNFYVYKKASSTGNFTELTNNASLTTVMLAITTAVGDNEATLHFGLTGEDDSNWRGETPIVGGTTVAVSGVNDGNEDLFSSANDGYIPERNGDDLVFENVAVTATSGDYTYTVSGGKATITDYTGSAANLSIPATLGGYPVTAIGNYAFSSCSSLTSITIPNSVTSIGEHAFEMCRSLTSITIPNSVTSIGVSAFLWCDSLTSVAIPNSMTSISAGAFLWCGSLTSITIPDSVTSIGDMAFLGCSKLTGAYFSGNAPIMGNVVFSGCASGFTVYYIQGKTGWTTPTWYGYRCVSPAFVSVTGIIGVPTTATAGTDLMLTGTVAPSGATNQTIVWSVNDAGTTGATISGNTLSTTAAGSVTVTATITKGLTATMDYWEDFTITVNAAPPAPTVTSVNVSPETVTVQQDDDYTFSATVTGTNSPAQTVTWSVYGNTSVSTTINASGLLTIAADETAATLTVTAISTVDNNKSGTATVTVTTTPPAFVAVTDITSVPATATAGTPLTLTGTVVPADATNQTVAWSVYNAGDTGASIVGNTLSTTTAGIVAVRATITNGLTESTDYTQDFNITVTAAPVTTYAITATAGSGGSISPDGSVSVTEGSSQTFTITSNSAYRINSVTVDGVNQGAITTYTFTNVTANHTISSTFTRTSGGGGGGGGGSSSTPATPAAPTYNAVVKVGNSTETTLLVTVDKDNGIASTDMGSQKLTSSGTIITVPSIPDVNAYSVGIPVPDLSTLDVQGTLTLHTDNGSVTVLSNMLTGVSDISRSKAEITIGQGNKENLPEDVKAAIGDRPLVRLTLSIDGKQTNWNNRNAPVTVSIPYTPTAAEQANPESIVVWYIDGSGKVVTVPNGHYDPATGRITFDTTHFSDYAVAYNPVSFNDVAAGAWYNKAVGFIAARGITSGTGNGKYSPEAKLTRGEFLVMLMKAYGIAPDTSSTDNFSDAGNTYYTGYLATAKRLGITTGVGNNQYAPGKEITRQEMFTLLYNVLKAIGQLPQGDSGKKLSDFTDAGQIASWAKDAMTLLVETGTIGGSTGELNPGSTTTRAEMAQVLYNVLKK